MTYKCSVCGEVYNYLNEVELLLKTGEIISYIESEHPLDIKIKDESEIICSICAEERGDTN